MNTAKIMKAIDVLQKEGNTAYDEPPNRWEAVGMALGHGVREEWGTSTDIARAAYEAFESANNHMVCSVLDWIFPNMHPMTQENGATVYFVGLGLMQTAIGERIVKASTTYNEKTGEYNTATYRVKLVIEEL